LGRLFGTDGVRGLANRELTAELALDIAVSAAHVLADVGAFAGHRPTAIVGRDTRVSGEFLEAAVVAGLASAGVDVTVVGVLPTPGTAFLTDATGADLGVMLSASHNPMPDNGIKLFARGGIKLDDAIEDAIEARMGESWDRPVGPDVGRVQYRPELANDYLNHLVSSLPGRAVLQGMRVVADCAHGAASWIGPEALRAAGADVIAINNTPDGYNINDDCGSTHLAGLAAAVRDHRAQVGVAWDGDADRCLAVDESGVIVDGDHILAILAMDLAERGQLTGGTVVSTVMANLGFRLAMQGAGITVVETGVGDRYVLEAMGAAGYTLGGEQSGHVIMSAHATTGDGVLTALHLLTALAATGMPMSKRAAIVTKVPQVLINVPGVDKSRVDSCPALTAEVAAAMDRLGTTGRVLLRPSGTEPVVRVMVEAVSADDAQEIADRLAAVVAAELALAD
jgi:phosphoglucosamine mutase